MKRNKIHTTFKKGLEILLKKKNDWRQSVNQQVCTILCDAVLGA